MPNMSAKKTPMPTQDASVRARNFDEVATGYTAEMAKAEATRCLGCKNMPCVSGCPVNVQIPHFIKKIADGDFEGALSRKLERELDCQGRTGGEVLVDPLHAESLAEELLDGKHQLLAELEAGISISHATTYL